MGVLNTLFGRKNVWEKDLEEMNPHSTFESSTEDEDYVGIVIHFTPHMTYVYISENNEAESNTDQSNIEMYNYQDVYFEVSGTYIHISNVQRCDIDTMLQMYKIPESEVPFIKISVC